MSQYVRSSDLNKTVITQVKDNEFFVETDSDARLGFEIDPYVLNFIDIENGPMIHVNKDFLGKGLVTQILRLDSSEQNNLIIKVTIDNDF